MKKKARRGRRKRRESRRRKELKDIFSKKEVRKGLWILRAPLSFHEEKGLISEEKARRAFEYFQRKKTKFHRVGVITKVTPTEHYSQEDKEDIDIKVEFQNGEILFVEVKNRWNQKLEENLRRENRCLIAIPWDMNNERARDITWTKANRFLQKQKRLVV